jgi:hypothetical protein
MRQVVLNSLPHLLGAYTSSRKTETPSAPTADNHLRIRLRVILRSRGWRRPNKPSRAGVSAAHARIDVDHIVLAKIAHLPRIKPACPNIQLDADTAQPLRARRSLCAGNRRKEFCRQRAGRS